jgi:hypothetical protein
MKKRTTFILAIVILALGSCSKKNSSGNSFSFKGNDFPIGLSARDTLHRSITFASADFAGTVTVFFPDSFPNTPGNTYQVSLEKGFPYYSAKTKLQLTIGASSYYPTGNGVTSIFYDLSSDKKLTIYTQTNDPIWMKGGPVGGAQDSAQLSFKVSE